MSKRSAGAPGVVQALTALGLGYLALERGRYSNRFRLEEPRDPQAGDRALACGLWQRAAELSGLDSTA